MLVNVDCEKAVSAATSLLCAFSFCTPTTPTFRMACWDNEVYSYDMIKERFPGLYQKATNKTDYGFTWHQNDGVSTIGINEKQPLDEQRFTMAHELGHLELGHTQEDIFAEVEADLFACVFLCPAPVADFFGLTSAEQYSSVFCVPKEQAMTALAFRDKSRGLMSSYHYNYIQNLMSLHLRGYHSLDEYWKDADNQIVRDVELRNHPLYDYENLPLVMNTLCKMARGTPVIKSHSGIMIDLIPFRQLKQI